MKPLLHNPTTFKLNLKKFVLYSSLFLVIYFIVDTLNMSYAQMSETYGWWLVLVNIGLNISMALLSGYLLSLSEGLYQAKKVQLRGENLSFLAVGLGLLTYGCTSCVIAMFATFGITYSVILLPFAGLPYKLLSLLLLVIGIFWAKHEMKKNHCKAVLRRSSYE